MRKSRGSALFQYLIIITLVAMAIVPVFWFCGQQIKSILEGYSNTQQANNIQMALNSLDDKLITQGKVSAGQMGGTPENPVRKCNGDICSLDYGTMVLNKVPSKLDNAVETSGSAGDTEVVMGLVQQVATQLENNPNVTPDQLAKIKSLIAYGKDIINIEQKFESVYPQAKQYTLDATSQINALKGQLANNTITQAQYNTKVSSINSTLSGQLNQLEMQQNMNDKLALSTGNKVSVDFTWMRYLLDPNANFSFASNSTGASITSSPPSYDDFISGKVSLSVEKSLISNATSSQRSPVGQYLTQLKELTDDKTLDPAAQQITKILSKEIYQVSQTVNDKSSIFSNTFMMNNNKNIEDTLNKSPTATTRLDLSIICSSNRASYNFDNDECK